MERLPGAFSSLLRWLLAVLLAAGLPACEATLHLGAPDDGAQDDAGVDGGSDDGADGDSDSDSRVDADTIGVDADADVTSFDTTGTDSSALDSGQGQDTAVAFDTTADLGSCTAGPLASLVTVSAVPGAGSGRDPVAAALPDNGAILAWAAGDGVHVVRVDALGQPAGAEWVVGGLRPHGVAARGDVSAVLVQRSPDIMALVRLDGTGGTLSDEILVGNTDHNVQGSEWLDDWRAMGRLTATLDGYAAYFTIRRLWPDGIAHQGDTLRILDANGQQLGGGWDWGCSHSVGLLLAHNASTLGPVCMSDCYPTKGIHANHQNLVFTDASGNCSGGIDSNLGGLAPVSDGFWLTFDSPVDRTSRDVALVHIGNDYAAGSPIWLTTAAGDESNARLAPYEGGLLAAWQEGGAAVGQRLDASGTPRSVPEPLGTPLGADFFGFANGDVGWAASGGGVQLVRLRACP